MEFQSKKLVPNLDTTNLTVDPALAVVGGSSKDADEAQPTRPKRKLRQCTYCVRSFTEEEKLVQNINVEHYITPLLKEVKPDPEKRVSENMLSVHEILSQRESNRS